MPYKCAFGCTSYDPCCDACESATQVESTGWYPNKQDEIDTHKAALRGMTLEEYRNQEHKDDE